MESSIKPRQFREVGRPRITLHELVQPPPSLVDEHLDGWPDYHDTPTGNLATPSNPAGSGVCLPSSSGSRFLSLTRFDYGALSWSSDFLTETTHPFSEFTE